MTAQRPAFRLSLERRMEAYRERFAKRVDAELQRRGEDYADLAHALKISPRTAERWVSGDTSPQRRHRKPIADYLDLPMEELWPDLEAEEKRLVDQLNRIEDKVDLLLKRLGVDLPPAPPDELLRPPAGHEPNAHTDADDESVPVVDSQPSNG